MSYTPYKFSHYWHLNQTHQKGGFSWREFQDEQVPSSTLVLQGILYSEWACSKCSDSEWAQNSDSETPVKKHNRTSGTDLS